MGPGGEPGQIESNASQLHNRKTFDDCYDIPGAFKTWLKKNQHMTDIWEVLVFNTFRCSHEHSENVQPMSIVIHFSSEVLQG